VFDLPYDEIADTLGRSESAVRQLAHRAREHVQARQPKRPVDKARHSELTMRFMAAAGSGDFNQVVSLLAPDAVLVSDGGGKKKAALRPIHGADKIARWLFAVIAQNPNFEIRMATLNGETAYILYFDDEPDTVTFLDTTDGLITDLYLIRNPDKLTTVPPRHALD
jgi:RNA polymerase sigma-70 factor (ECF subfamily)